jgi:hypothetical protein
MGVIGRPDRFPSDKLDAQRVCDPACDLVLHPEQIA